MLIKYGAVNLGEKEFEAEGIYAGIKTYWYYNGDIYVSEYHENELVYTGNNGTHRLCTAVKLKEQCKAGVCLYPEVCEIIAAINQDPGKANDLIALTEQIKERRRCN